MQIFVHRPLELMKAICILCSWCFPSILPWTVFTPWLFNMLHWWSNKSQISLANSCYDSLTWYDKKYNLERHEMTWTVHAPNAQVLDSLFSSCQILYTLSLICYAELMNKVKTIFFSKNYNAYPGIWTSMLH